jgi:hypothetical protein
MRRLLALVGSFGIFVLGGVAGMTAARADVVTNETLPVDVIVLVPCTGHLVELTGSLHVVLSVTTNGNHVSGTILLQPQGISGTDLTTGARYRGTGETLTTFGGTFTNGEAQETFVNNFKIVGKGSAPNYVVHENTHVTIDAGGTTTATLDNLSISCS